MTKPTEKVKKNDSLIINQDESLLDIYWSKEQLELLKTRAAKGTNKTELLMFTEYCKATGLNPFLKQIYCTVYTDKFGNRNLTIITGIDGMRKIAHSTGVYAGRDEAVFEYDEKGKPKKVKVTVKKIVQGNICSFTATAVYNEYLPSQSNKRFMWNKMQEWMIEKCCEAKALRMAFTQELSGIYVDSESDQIEGNIKELNPESEITDINELVGLPDKIKTTLPKTAPPIETVKEAVELAKEVVKVAPQKAKKEGPKNEVATEVVDNIEAAEESITEAPVEADELKSFFQKTRRQGWKDAEVQKLQFLLTGAKRTSQLTREGYNMVYRYIILDKNSPETIHGEDV